MTRQCLKPGDIEPTGISNWSEDGSASILAAMMDRSDHLHPAAARSVGGRLSAAGARACAAALDILFPPACVGCRRTVDGQSGLCGSCWRGMRFIERPFCERLGTPFAQDLGAGLQSPEALARPPVYGRARAVVRFEDGPARKLMHGLKYGDRLDLARPLGAWMARAGFELLADANLIVPVPLHRARLWKRQFNQAAALAREVSRASGVAWDPMPLLRVKATASQVGMSRAQRIENVQGAFTVDPALKGSVAARRIVLVDDVLTTGSTLNAASRALLRAGAANVDVLVFARVVTES